MNRTNKVLVAVAVVMLLALFYVIGSTDAAIGPR